MQQDNYNDVLKKMDDINEQLYGIRPFGTVKQLQVRCDCGQYGEEPTVRELTISEMVGRPIKIQKQ